MYRIYRVQNGETLESIASKLGVSTDVLRQLNGNVNVVDGTYLIVPQTSTMFSKYIVKKGDNIYEIARKYNVDPKQLLLLNGLNNNDIIYPNREILVPNKDMNLYVTTDGDTLNKVVQKLGTTVNDLQNENSTIYLLPDQLLVIRR